MHRARCSLPLLAVAMLLPASLPAQPANGEVMAVVRRLFDGMRAGDSAMVRSVFHPSVRMITVSSRGGQLRTTIVNGADAFVTAVGTPHPQAWDERISNEKVQVDGPLASVWLDYAFFQGSTFSHCGIDHFLVARNDAGEWKILELADTRRTDGCGQGNDDRDGSPEGPPAP